MTTVIQELVMGFFNTTPSLRLAERLDALSSPIAQTWLDAHALQMGSVSEAAAPAPTEHVDEPQARLRRKP